MTEPAAAEAPRRRAFRCKDGCFHLRWDSLMLSFTPQEFAQLRALLRDAEPSRVQPVPVESRPATLH